MKHQLIQVTWHDAHAVSETWTTREDLDNDPCVVTSIGYLIAGVKPNHVVISQSIIMDDSNHIDHVIAIPNGMIKRIDRLKVSVLLPLETIND
jgi:hypothetical protein